MCTADAINKAKEFAANVATTDQLRNENAELKKLSESLKTELESTRKALAQAEQNLETERQQSKDALHDVQDRLDKRLDESLAIDNQLLSKFYTLELIFCCLLCLPSYRLNFAFCSSGRLRP